MSTNSNYMVFFFFIAYEKDKKKTQKSFDIIKSKLEQ